jgi:N-acetyl-gamma-glutamyl-phosphate reductase
MHKVAAGVLGASGYAGRELCSLIVNHPAMELCFATANEQRGKTVSFGQQSVTFSATDDADLGRADIVFCALPHGFSGSYARAAVEAGAKAVDLSSDLRPGNTDAPAQYGLTEFERASVSSAELVANPGCYPTAILFGLAPLAQRGLVRADSVVNVSAASGVTGAGNSPKIDLLFGEVTENFKAYSVGNQHRHLPEMKAMLAEWGVTTDLLFTPHLLPVARGILATVTVELTETLSDPAQLFESSYADEPFVQVMSSPPTLRDVTGTNSVKICAVVAQNLTRPAVTIFSAIDNLVKGAAGQAIQNANLMLGIPEQAGLTA